MFKHVASWGAPDTNCHVRIVAVIQNGKASYSRTHSNSKAHVSEFPSPPEQLFAWTREWALWQNSIFKNIKVCEDKPIDECIDFCSLKAPSELRSETAVLFLGLTRWRVKRGNELPEIPNSPSILWNYSKLWKYHLIHVCSALMLLHSLRFLLNIDALKIANK